MTIRQRLVTWWRALWAHTEHLVKVPAPVPVAPDPRITPESGPPITPESGPQAMPTPAPAPSNERDDGRLRVDNDGRLVHWPSPPAPEPSRVKCNNEMTVWLKCVDGEMRDSHGTRWGVCANCMGAGEVCLQ